MADSINMPERSNVAQIHLNPPPSNGREARKRAEALVASQGHSITGALGQPYKLAGGQHSYRASISKL